MYRGREANATQGSEQTLSQLPLYLCACNREVHAVTNGSHGIPTVGQAAAFATGAASVRHGEAPLARGLVLRRPSPTAVSLWELPTVAQAGSSAAALR